MNSFVFLLLSLDFPEPELDDSPEGFAEDAAGHFGRAQLAVDEDDRDLPDLEAQFVGGVLHFDLEAVSLHLDRIQVNGLQYFPGIAHEAGGGVEHPYPQDGPDIGRRVIGHDDAADGPVHDAHAVAVTRTYGEVAPLFRASGVQAKQIVGIVGKVGIHLEDVIVAMVQGPAEAGQIGGSESLFSAPLDQVEAVRELRLKPFHDAGRPVGGAVVDDKDVELADEGEHLPADGFNVLLFVVGRDDDDLFVHISWVLARKLRKKNRKSADDDLIPVGAHGNDLDRAAGFLLDEGDVLLERFREILVAADLGDVLLPAGEVGVHRFHLVGTFEGEIRDHLPVDPVGRGHPDGVEGVHDVGLHHDEFVHAVHHDGVFQGDEVQPAAAAGTARGGAVLTADAAQALARGVEEFRREGTASHAGAVCLEDTHHLAYAAGSHAEAGAHARRHRIGGGDEGIGAEVDVQHRPLGAFGKDGDVLVQVAVHDELAVDEGEALHLIDGLVPLDLVFGDVEGELVVGQEPEVLVFQRFIPLDELGGEDVAHAESVAAGLVHVGGADALEGGADLALALRRLAGGVEHPVGGEDQVRLLGDEELAGDVHALGLDGLDLVHQDDRVDDDAVADDVHRIRAENAGGDGVEHEAVPVEHEGMARVGTALEAGDHLVTGRQDVDDLALALVAPLEAEDHVYLLHKIPTRLKI